jgi:DNA-binding transcriptional MerR regulator
MAKSRDAFRTISEVSEWLDTPAHVLRFWESKFSQIKPVKRAGGRRYYRPDDMALLAGIKTLLHDQGLTIKGAQKLLREKGVKHVAALGADPRAASDTATGEIVDAEAEEVFEIDDAPAPPEPVRKVDPVEWDPEDPWPADPVPVAEEPAPQPPEPEPEPEVEPDPVAARERAAEPDTPEEVSLPFVRKRAEAATMPPPQPQADVLPFAKPSLPAPPPLPNEDAIEGHPGVLSRVLEADRTELARQASRIAPLAARLRDIASRIDATGG